MTGADLWIENKERISPEFLSGLNTFGGKVINNMVRRRRLILLQVSGGAEGIRTPYLLTASQSFSQVNYGPLYRYNLPEISP